MYRLSYEPLSPSLQRNQWYSLLNRLNLDMDMENLFNTQEYYAGQGSGPDYYGSAPVKDDSPFEEVAAPVKAKKVSERRQKTVTTKNKESSKTWTTEEEVMLCQAWCDVSENSIKRNAMKSMGFWLNYFEKETGLNRGYDAILRKWKNRVHPRIGAFCTIFDNVQRRNESGSCDLTVYQKRVWNMQLTSAQGGLNLNEEADGSWEEVREVRPIGRDRAKKKAASSSRSEDLYVAGGGLVDMVADK
ncbi:hypothetical protein Tco_0736702 [Tanacetum coccineum]